MHLLNFAHPLSEAQLEAIGEQLGQTPATVRNVAVQFEVEDAFVPQVVAMLDSLAISAEDWQIEGWVIVLPSLNYITAILLAELHARLGHFPTIIRLKPVQSNYVTQYAVAEIINLEQVRQEGRKRR
ncbi:hypothetical protein HC928_02145 [bacterium]|nr:hypothetical protein [bacterium]